jgi:2-dehydro-3-deoxyphosphogluconate aldolase/(4S)-4-hydroxy-2-oxoglutarate aldolase
VTPPRSELETAIAAQGVVPVIRTQTVDNAVDTALACAAAGMRVVELTTTTPEVGRAVSALRSEGVVVGVGTVRSRADVAGFAHDGAQFVVSYFNPPGFVEAALAAGVAAIPGAITPTEIQTAVNQGATTVKVFPAWQSDPRLIAELLPLVGPIGFIATGGIDAEKTVAWLRAGALAVGTGRSLGTAHEVGAETVTTNARELLRIAQNSRFPS